MESMEIYEEARRVMDRANEVGASPDEVLIMLAVIMAHLLHQHSPDAFHAGEAIAKHNMQAIDCYGRLRRGTSGTVLH